MVTFGSNFGVYAVSRTCAFVNLYPMIYKSRVMRGKSGNLRANMYVYKTVGDGAHGRAHGLVLDARRVRLGEGRPLVAQEHEDLAAPPRRVALLNTIKQLKLGVEQRCKGGKK